nr:Chain C, Heat shock factor protein 2 [Mus musculus]7NA5_C Chain C, Heat shock factor protein 2 [Mus musculus]
YGFRNVVHI